MALPKFSMKQLMEAGVHFGHHTRRWNPLMTPYVYGVKDKIHIINLNKTAPMLHNALVALEAIAAAGGKILFVSTKHQAKDIIKDAAERCGQHYVNNRWLGGMMTNWSTVSQSIRRLKKMEMDIENAEKLGLTKKEVLNMTREAGKLRDIFGGILDMHGTPQAIVIVDVPREYNAVREAKNLDMPIVAICDTNANPELIDYPIPGNDDASRAVQLYCDLFVEAILSGIEKRLGGAASKKVSSDMMETVADEIEEKAKEKQARVKVKTSEEREERREKMEQKIEEKMGE
ncbi:MAG: 30S ribosomal protein S2 [Alphaproteobacteria bacterium]|nr:30S ribosomal protein S2 [Alphaproteobacteria bacterium]MCL2890235.1 30S ribosomal protein S2 [Alphaproteobacteria bacterium]